MTKFIAEMLRPYRYIYACGPDAPFDDRLQPVLRYKLCWWQH
ncbi:MAG: hypothetical protein AB4352_14120 [Hormoscilla sp.]